MSWQTKLERISDVLLRIPPLFIMDSILRMSFLSSYFPYQREFTYYLLWLLLMTFFFLSSLVMFSLSLRQLLQVYNYALATILLYTSFGMNHRYIFTVVNREEEFSDMTETTYLSQGYFKHIFIQICLSYLFIALWIFRLPARRDSNTVTRSSVKSALYFSFMLPVTFSRVFYQDLYIFQWMPQISLIIPLSLLVKDFLAALMTSIFIIKHSYDLCKWTLHEHGIQVFLENQWLRLRIPKVLRLFWLSRFSYQLITLTLYSYLNMQKKNGHIDYFSQEVWLFTGKQLLIQSCETVIALLGLTSIVSFISHYVGLVMAHMVGSETEEDRNMGTVSAILFFILALQTGLTGLEPEKRLVRLNRNFCLLSTAILHFVHSMVNPLLLSLSASRNLSWQRHLRVLGMCVFLFVFPLWLLYYLWSWNSISTWLLAVTAFSTEVMIKVLISVLVYALFMLDAHRETFWEGLDDYVYYIQSTGNTIEFFFGIFLFCNGAWIMMFESGGTIRAIMMCIHAYFNIWLQAKEGWKVFMRRRTAVNKINLLEEASPEKLREVNDVCAICYQELNTARITNCKHYFHGVCLRKWLYVQDNCPLCHEVIYQPENDKQSADLDEMNQNRIPGLLAHVNNDL
ncbi:hypothetical protein ScPMuIL_000256 [Solemya velum]